MPRQKVIITLLCSAGFLLVSACVPISPNPPPRSAAWATVNAAGSRITGQVFWASAPAPQVIVDLRPRAQSEDPASTLQRVTADSNGTYVYAATPGLASFP